MKCNAVWETIGTKLTSVLCGLYQLKTAWDKHFWSAKRTVDSELILYLMEKWYTIWTINEFELGKK